MNMIRMAAVVAALALFTGGALAAEEGAKQKAVLVTGASSGIGLAIAEKLADNGYYVYAGARKAEDLRRLDAMQNISSVRLDVTVQEDIDDAAAFVREAGRGLWGVVNNAGVVSLASLADGPESAMQFTFDINVFGVFRVNQAFLPLLRESGGRTTAISSISAYTVSPGDGGYSASKFALEGYTDTLAVELADSGVHVSVVAPGGYKSKIRAKMLAQLLAADAAGEIDLSAEQREQLVETEYGNNSLKEPDEVADAVLHVMSSEAPKKRYMVTPNEEQAQITIRAAMRRLLELNQDQPYSYDRDELIALIDELLAAEKL
jgi:NAD(P)-dependent dehydrogenase (short-subunit alcohol dehydrogenase family)